MLPRLCEQPSHLPSHHHRQRLLPTQTDQEDRDGQGQTVLPSRRPQEDRQGSALGQVHQITQQLQPHAAEDQDLLPPYLGKLQGQRFRQVRALPSQAEENLLNRRQVLLRVAGAQTEGLQYICVHLHQQELAVGEHIAIERD